MTEPSTRLDIRGFVRAADVRPFWVIVSIGAGTFALGSAVGLSATAAWMIATAAQMPGPHALGLAAVAVRTFGIGRGLFRYLERLASHHTALTGVVALRTDTYDKISTAGASKVLGLKRGDIVARLGGDIDAMGDAVVRSLIPVGVAGTVSVFAIVISSWFWLAGGLALAACLVAAAVLSGLLTWRSTKIAAEAGTEAAARVSTATLEAIDGAIEHRIWGTDRAAMDELRAANRAAEEAAELSAKPAAWSAAALQASQGAAILATLWIAVQAGLNAGLAPTGAAVVALLPLAAFEAVSAVPGAVQQAFRSAAAARRVQAMTEASGASSPMAPAAFPAADAPTLRLEGLSAAWPGARPTRPVTAAVTAGGALGIVGRSGIGKTTLLLTMSGAMTPAAGAARIGDREVSTSDIGPLIALTPEDAHVFGTTVLENLRVSRGSLTPDEARQALRSVGLAAWLDSLPDGLDTELGSGGHTVSGGERRRLLLARALVSSAPIQLIDEPAEHLDADGIEALRAMVNAMRATGRSVVIVTHDLGILDVVDEVVNLDDD